MTIKSEPRSSPPIYNRSQIAQQITDGIILVIYRSKIINATSWAPYHPGGALALLHFVGRDATDEIEAYHSSAALQKMERFVIGRIEDTEEGWSALTPPIALGLVRHPDGVKGHWASEGRVTLGRAILQNTISLAPAAAPIPLTPNPTTSSILPEVIRLTPQQLEPLASNLDPRAEKLRSDAYHNLKARIVEAGLFDRPGPLAGYGSDLMRYVLLGSSAFALFFLTNTWAGQMLSAVFLGLFYHQLTFLAHDAGHTGITGAWWWDRVIGMVVANWIGGLSLGWWCNNHNIHHLVTNHPEHDPDIQHIPFFAISKRFFDGLWSTYYKRVMAFDRFSKTMIKLQHKLYFVLLALARFNLYANSYNYLMGPQPRHDAFWRFEIAGVAFYWLYFGAMLRSQTNWKMRIAYLVVSHVVTSPVHVQITLSHFACSTDDLGPTESFPSRQLRTTMDVTCSPEVEFLHGGLHLQVTHHLFPRLPRHNLRKASLHVKQYCAEQDIIYREHGFVEGNRQVLSVLEDVANQLQFLKNVAESEIDERLQ